MSASGHLRCPSLVANSAGPATSTSAEQPAASPPLLPSITDSFLSLLSSLLPVSRSLTQSFPRAHWTLVHGISSGNYGNGSKEGGHSFGGCRAQQQFASRVRAPNVGIQLHAPRGSGPMSSSVKAMTSGQDTEQPLMWC